MLRKVIRIRLRSSLDSGSQLKIVSGVSWGEYIGQEKSYIARTDFHYKLGLLDHRYHTAWKAKDYLVAIDFDQLVQLV